MYSTRIHACKDVTFQMSSQGCKSNFDRTLVRSQKKICHIHFFAVTKSDCKFTQFAFCNKFYLTLCRNGYTYLSRDLYISCDVYICPTKFSGVGFCPTTFKLCPTKIKSDRTNVLPSQIFICSPASVIFMCQNDNCIRPVILHKWALGHTHCHQVSQDTIINLSS